MSSFVYLCTIEGVGNATGQVKYCHDLLPEHADGAYVLGLWQPPDGGSAEWDIVRSQCSVSRFSVVLDPDVGPVNWRMTAPPVVGNLSLALNNSTTTLDFRPGHSLATGDIVYIDRETIKLGTLASDQATGCTRGYAGSTADTHRIEAEVRKAPPSLVGRLLTVYRVAALDSSAGAEAIQLRGFISGEQAFDAFLVRLVAAGSELNIELGAPVDGLDNRHDMLELAENFDGGAEGVQRLIGWQKEFVVGGEPKRIGNASGSYRWLPGIRAVIAESDRVTLLDDPEQNTLVWADSEIETERRYDGPWRFVIAYQVLLSDINADYPPFGYDDGGPTTASSNVAVILANLLLSKDGSNGALSRNFDLGSHESTDGGLFPVMAAGIDASLVDEQTFWDESELRLDGIEANSLWLGVEPRRLNRLAETMLAPLGITLGARRDGQFTLLALGDVYPDDTKTTIDSDDLIRDDAWLIQGVARAIDEVLISAEETPEGDYPFIQTVREIDLADHVPRAVGQRLRYETPYRAADLIAGQAIDQRIATWISQLARRYTMITVWVGPGKFNAVDIGDAIELSDIFLPDPTTGDFLTSSESLNGRVTAVSVDWTNETAEITMVVFPARNVALWSPSAESSAASQTTTTISVEASNFVDSGNDTDAFDVGDKVALLDSDLQRLDDNAPAIDSKTTTSLTLDARFSSGGTPIDVELNNYIVYADYDELTTTQQNHVSLADGPVDSTPDVGTANDAPYVWGA